MKIRMGFVSNSSSTSFVIIGNKMGWSVPWEKAKELINEGRLYAMAGEGFDGDNFFPVSEDMWESHNKYGGNNISFYDVQHMAEDSATIKKSDIKGDMFSLFGIDVSYHSCETLKDFEQHLDIPPAVSKIDPKIKKKRDTIVRLKQELKDDGYNITDI